LAIYDVDQILNGKLTADELEQIRQLIRQLALTLPDIKKLIGLNRDIVQRYADLSEQARAIFDRLLSFEDRYEEYSGGLIREMDDLTENCNDLARWVWVIVDGKVLDGVIVDCSHPSDRQQMIDNGLVADMNLRELNGELAWVIIR